MGRKSDYEQPSMMVVGLQPSKATLAGMSKRKSYEVIDVNPFAGSDEGESGVKELTDPNLWDEEW